VLIAVSLGAAIAVAALAAQTASREAAEAGSVHRGRQINASLQIADSAASAPRPSP